MAKHKGKHSHPHHGTGHHEHTGSVHHANSHMRGKGGKDGGNMMHDGHPSKDMGATNAVFDGGDSYAEHGGCGNNEHHC